jgi:membrane protease YdiL (CAAX protease family)
MLRGPRYRWWKPLLCLLLFLLLFLLMAMLAIVPVLIAGLVSGAPDMVAYLTRTTTDIANLGPIGFIYLNLSLIVLIPASGLSIWIVHGIRPRFLSSVAGGIRWGWLLRCIAVILPLWALYTALGVLAVPFTSARPDHWIALLVIVVLMTPLQAAGEEYFFRGWIMQNVGAWFAQPIVGLVASLIVSAVAFSTAHLSPDPWVLGTIACLAVAFGPRRLADRRTGGRHRDARGQQRADVLLRLNLRRLVPGLCRGADQRDSDDAGAGGSSERCCARLDFMAGQARRVAALLSAIRPIGSPNRRPAGAGLPPHPVPVALVTSTSFVRDREFIPKRWRFGPQLIAGRRVSALGGGS